MSETTPPVPKNLPFPEPGSAPGAGAGASPEKKSHLGLWITLGVMALLLGGALFWYFHNFHASIRPVHLSEREQQVVREKIETIESASMVSDAQGAGTVGNLPDDALVESNQVRVLSPEEEREKVRKEREDIRTIVLTQREINGMLNYNTDLGNRLKMDLKPGFIDIEYVQPIPSDIKVIGGQTWRFSMDVAMNKVPGGPLEFKLKDVSVGGIPLPAAWLEMVGIRKNEDLIEMIKREFPAFEKFEQGIDYVDISSGQMKVRLAE